LASGLPSVQNKCEIMGTKRIILGIAIVAVLLGLAYWHTEVAAEKESAKQEQMVQEQRRLVQELDIQMVLVRGGTFTMGCTSEQGSDCSDWEKPAHSVSLNDFYIGKYEVSQQQWSEVMGANPSYFKGDKLPVEKVNWNDVQEFIRALNAKTGKNYRLPTEAEWEYAAREGSQSKGYRYSGGNSAGEVAWYYENSGNSALKDSEWNMDDLGKYNCRPHPVGSKKANALGIYDMSGNVWEWCSDWYGAYPASAQTDPAGASAGANRVYRGGSWSDLAQNMRVSLRFNISPDYRNDFLGFRLARSENQMKN
jgi:formylglycine-generating enzyme required for sulfatase activity